MIIGRFLLNMKRVEQFKQPDKQHLNEITRVLNPKGIVMCFGWNSSGVGIRRGMELIEVLLVPHGGSHNDTICTVERKIPTLF